MNSSMPGWHCPGKSVIWCERLLLLGLMTSTFSVHVHGATVHAIMAALFPKHHPLWMGKLRFRGEVAKVGAHSFKCPLSPSSVPGPELARDTAMNKTKT